MGPYFSHVFEVLSLSGAGGVAGIAAVICVLVVWVRFAWAFFADGGES